MQIGHNQRALGLLLEASNSYKRALKYKPANSEGADVPYIALFEVQVEMEDFRAANNSIREALSLNVKPDSWRRLVFFQKEKLFYSKDEVYATLDQAMQKTEGNIDIITLYASMTELYGDIDKAIALWRQASEVYPDKKAIYEAELNRIRATHP